LAKEAGTLNHHIGIIEDQTRKALALYEDKDYQFGFKNRFIDHYKTFLLFTDIHMLGYFGISHPIRERLEKLLTEDINFSKEQATSTEQKTTLLSIFVEIVRKEMPFDEKVSILKTIQQLQTKHALFKPAKVNGLMKNEVRKSEAVYKKAFNETPKHPEFSTKISDQTLYIELDFATHNADKLKNHLESLGFSFNRTNPHLTLNYFGMPLNKFSELLNILATLPANNFLKEKNKKVITKDEITAIGNDAGPSMKITEGGVTVARNPEFKPAPNKGKKKKQINTNNSHEQTAPKLEEKEQEIRASLKISTNIKLTPIKGHPSVPYGVLWCYWQGGEKDLEKHKALVEQGKITQKRYGDQGLKPTRTEGGEPSFKTKPQSEKVRVFGVPQPVRFNDGTEARVFRFGDEKEIDWKHSFRR
jgi:hypothetical protein